MRYELVIRPEAEHDLREAFIWYEDKRSGLGYDFLLQVEAGRKYLIKRFPYNIIYLFKATKVFILAVIHGRRKPSLVKERIHRHNR